MRRRLKPSLARAAGGWRLRELGVADARPGPRPRPVGAAAAAPVIGSSARAAAVSRPCERYPGRDPAIIGLVPAIYVTGHRNPDTDSIASAIGYAELKRRLDPRNEYVAGPARGLQHPDPMAARAQRRADEPEFLPHVMLRACDVMQTELPDAPGSDEPIREAGLAMARAELELVPVVDEDGALRRGA